MDSHSVNMYLQNTNIAYALSVTIPDIGSIRKILLPIDSSLDVWVCLLI